MSTVIITEKKGGINSDRFSGNTLRPYKETNAGDTIYYLELVACRVDGDKEGVEIGIFHALNASDVIQEACDALQSLLRAIDRKARSWDVMNYKDVHPSSPDRHTPKSKKYQAYFRSLIDEMRDPHKFTKARRPGNTNHYMFASGFTSIMYVAKISRNVYTHLWICFQDYERTKKNV